MKKLKHLLEIVFIATLFFACSEQKLEEQNLPNSLQTRSENDDLGLKDVTDFPIGNVWSGGHEIWGTDIGTDLGGPRDNYTPNAYGDLSTVHHKNLNIVVENGILAKEFSSITPEMALKMHNICVSPDSIDFREADAMMKFAESKGLRVHGHVFLFDKSVPQWALDYEKNNTWTQEQWRNWITDYVIEVMTRYKGRIASWDIINEIIDNNGNIKKDFFWLKVAGEDIVEYTFKLVESIDPQAKLFVNDNFQEMFILKNLGVIRYADNLKAKGCKVDGIGYQNHIVLAGTQGSYLPNKMAYEKAAQAGYLVHVSELDISVNLLGETLWQTNGQHRAQRKSYNDIARAYRDAVPADKRWGITVWNVADRNSYLNLLHVFDKIRIWPQAVNYPLLFDNDYNKKPAYEGLFKGIQGERVSWFAPLNIVRTRSENSVNYKDVFQNNISGYNSYLINVLGLNSTDANIHTTTFIENLGENK